VLPMALGVVHHHVAVTQDTGLLGQRVKVTVIMYHIHTNTTNKQAYTSCAR